MRIMGIDPGPDGVFAWAIWDEGRFIDFAEAGTRGLPDVFFSSADWYAIEVMRGGKTWGRAKASTVETVGRLKERLDLLGEQHISLDRVTIARCCGRPTIMRKGSRFGDAQVNRYLRSVYPELRDLRPLDKYNHILAACACAHAARGKIQALMVDRAAKRPPA